MKKLLGLWAINLRVIYYLINFVPELISEILFLLLLHLGTNQTPVLGKLKPLWVLMFLFNSCWIIYSMTSSLFTYKNSSNLIASITLFIQNINYAISAKEPYLSVYLNSRKKSLEGLFGCRSQGKCLSDGPWGPKRLTSIYSLVLVSISKRNWW